MCASCSDDGTVILYNYGSYRQEGVLQGHLDQVKICKFLLPFDALVSADLQGYIYFFGVHPSPRKNELLLKKKDDNESEVGTLENFPIRAMDFDAEHMLLFTGDEMGFLHKWDLRGLIEKLAEIDKRERKVITFNKDINPDLKSVYVPST